MNKLLIVDDEKLIRDVIKEYALNEEYLVIEASDGREAIEKTKEENPNLIILDIMMPNVDGYTALKEIRKFSNVPCIMLSARSEEFDKLTGFNIGVDDYVTKPFSPRELIARVKAVLKRGEGLTDEFIYKNLKIDFLGRTLSIKEKQINITPKEYELLCYLIQNKKVAISREALLSNVWGYDFYGDDRTIDTHIKMLRKNLGEYRNLIKTVRGMGYKFEV